MSDYTEEEFLDEQMMGFQSGPLGRPEEEEDEDDDSFSSTMPGKRLLSPFDPERKPQLKIRGKDDVPPSAKPKFGPPTGKQMPGMPKAPQMPQMPGMPKAPQMPGMPKMPKMPGMPQMPKMPQQGLVPKKDLQFPVQPPAPQAGAPAGMPDLGALMQQMMQKKQPQAPQQAQQQQAPMGGLGAMMGQQAPQQAPQQQQQDQFATIKKPGDPDPEFVGGDIDQMANPVRDYDAKQGLPQYGQQSQKPYNQQEILDKLAFGGQYPKDENLDFKPMGATFKVYANSPQQRDQIEKYALRFGETGSKPNISLGGIENKGGRETFVIVINSNNDSVYRELNRYLQSIGVEFEEQQLLPGQLEDQETKQKKEMEKQQGGGGGGGLGALGALLGGM